MINVREVENVSKLDAFKRYQYSIKRIADFEEIYVLKNSTSGEYAISVVDNTTLLHIWPAKEYSERFLEYSCLSYIPFGFKLDELEQGLLNLIRSKGYLIDVFPVGNFSGFVVDIGEFVNDLNIELTKYE